MLSKFYFNIWALWESGIGSVSTLTCLSGCGFGTIWSQMFVILNFECGCSIPVSTREQTRGLTRAMTSSWRPCDCLARWTFAQIHPMSQLSLFLDWDTLLMVTHVLGNSHLDYYSTLYMEATIKNTVEWIIMDTYQHTYTISVLY